MLFEAPNGLDRAGYLASLAKRFRQHADLAGFVQRHAARVAPSGQRALDPFLDWQVVEFDPARIEREVAVAIDDKQQGIAGPDDIPVVLIVLIVLIVFVIIVLVVGCRRRRCRCAFVQRGVGSLGLDPFAERIVDFVVKRRPEGEPGDTTGQRDDGDDSDGIENGKAPPDPPEHQACWSTARTR